MAAGNPPEYNKSVREFDVVTLDRIKRIDVEADFDVWKEYAYQVGIHPAAFLSGTSKREFLSYGKYSRWKNVCHSQRMGRLVKG